MDEVPSKCVVTLSGGKGKMICVKFSNCAGNKLAALDDDSNILIWQLSKRPHNLNVFALHVKLETEITSDRTIGCLNWSNSSDRWLVTGSNDDTLTKIWDANSGKEVCFLRESSSTAFGAKINAVCFSHDDSRVFTLVAVHELHVWNLKETVSIVFTDALSLKAECFQKIDTLYN